MRSIVAVTVGRSDYGIYLPVLSRLHAHPGIRLALVVSGAHLSPEFGRTIREIEADGFPIAAQVEMLLSSDTPMGMAKSMGLGSMGFAEAYGRLQPDLILVLGDRAEMHSAAVASIPFRIPLAHIHGGEISQGAIDDVFRHSMTKLSHLHFVATEENARRVIQMGEEPWRVTVSGAPALDSLSELPLLPARALEDRLGLSLSRPTLLVTYHPVTLELEETEYQARELLRALEQTSLPVIFTQPNADAGSRLLQRLIEPFLTTYPESRLVSNLGTQAYFSVMSLAAAMVGNSSSGLIEAPSFRLPVVNVGTRQDGRTRAANVIDVGYSWREVLAGIRQALEPSFRERLATLVNPYHTGCAAERIVQRLATVTLDDCLIRKRFQQWPMPHAHCA